jgi:hypothetical protein
MRTGDFFVRAGWISETSAIGRYAAATLGDVPLIGRSVGKTLAKVSMADVYLQGYTVLEGANTIGYMTGWWGFEKDGVQTGISAVATFGLALTFVPGIGWVTWAGIGIAAAALGAQIVYDEVKDAHQDEGQLEIGLKGAGFNDRAAAALSRQSDALSSVGGKVQIPFLAAYAQFKGLTPKQMRDWVNSLSPVQLNKMAKLLMEIMVSNERTRANFGLKPSLDEVLMGVFDCELGRHIGPHNLPFKTP